MSNKMINKNNDKNDISRFMDLHKGSLITLLLLLTWFFVLIFLSYFLIFLPLFTPPFIIYLLLLFCSWFSFFFLISSFISRFSSSSCYLFTLPPNFVLYPPFSFIFPLFLPFFTLPPFIHSHLLFSFFILHFFHTFPHLSPFLPFSSSFSYFPSSPFP